MTRKTKDKWVARVRDWRANEQSAAEFVAGKDYAETTLRWAASQVEGSVDAEGAREPDAWLSSRMVLRPEELAQPMGTISRRAS